MKRLKRAVCGGMAVLMLLVTPLNGYMQVQGAEVVAGATAWEILQTIFLSLGITMTIQDSSLVDEVCTEVVDTYNSWVTLNGFDKDYDKLCEDLTDLKKRITTKDDTGESVETVEDVIQIPEKTWNGLRAWSKEVATGETSIQSSVKYNFNSYKSVSYDEYFNKGMGKYEIKVSGNTKYIFDSMPDKYAMYAVQKGLNTNMWHMVVISNELFEGCYYTNVEAVNTYDNSINSSFNSCNGEIRTKADKYSKVINGKKYLIYYSLIMFPHTYNHIYQNVDMCTIPIYVGSGKGNQYSDSVIELLDEFIYSMSKSGNLTYNVVGGTSVESGAWDIVSKGRTWEDNALHGDVTITVPDDVTGDIVRVGNGEATVSDVISTTENPAISVDTTADTAIDYPMDISESIDYVDAKDITGDTVIDKDMPNYDDITDSDTSGEYYVQGLQNVFPFCLPFDVFDFLSVLSAPAEAPHFKVPIKYPTLSGMETYEVDLDLSKFNSVAKILRTA